MLFLNSYLIDYFIGLHFTNKLFHWLIFLSFQNSNSEGNENQILSVLILDSGVSKQQETAKSVHCYTSKFSTLFVFLWIIDE